MTTPTIPDYLLQVFEAEIHRLSMLQVEKVCTIYDLDYEAVQAALGEDVYTYIDLKNEGHLKIVRKRPPAPELPPEKRCQARVSATEQCKHARKYQNLCRQHYDLSRARWGHLRWGLCCDDALPPPKIKVRFKTQPPPSADE